jgi:nicotinic acid mononucleotide adenylyltransferase
VLRLFVQIDKLRFKVRKLQASETFTNPIHWKGIEFEYGRDPKFMMLWTALLPELTPKHAESLIELASARFPVDEGQFDLSGLCPDLVFPEGHSKEWVFYGGSFDPWHHGHQACLDLLPKDKTCFVVPDINPFKGSRHLELVPVVLELNNKIKFGANQHLVPTFILDEAKNPTVEWIEKLAREHANIQLSLLLGFDNFISITRWIRSKDLLSKLFKLYVVSRMETDTDHEIGLEKIRKLAPMIEVEFLGHHPYEGFSSTALRK